MWIDVTAPLEAGIVVWPGDAPFALRRDSTLARDGANVSSITMSAHTGTHVDAPAHYLEGAATIGEFPAEAGIGPARVIEVPEALEIRRPHLERFGITKGQRILLKTGNSAYPRRYRQALETPAVLSAGGAKYLVECGARLVGIDYLSVGDEAVHRILLTADVWIVEGLLLERVQPGLHDLVCLPMALVGADGAPARVMLRRSVA